MVLSFHLLLLEPVERRRKVPKIINKIPLLNIPDSPITSTSQDMLPIAEVVDNMLLYKDGGSALVLESTSLNFGLLSEREQEAVIAAYAATLNSLSFSVQILIRTLKKDISSYITYLDNAEKKIQNPKLTGLMHSYKEFIAETVKKKNVLGKRFFIILPFSSLELGVAKSFKATAKRSGPAPFSKDYALKKGKIVLYPRRDHIIRQASRLGLKLSQLSNLQLTELLFEIFNPKTPPVSKLEELETEKLK